MIKSLRLYEQGADELVSIGENITFKSSTTVPIPACPHAYQTDQP
jgi:hypothetical protein